MKCCWGRNCCCTNLKGSAHCLGWIRIFIVLLLKHWYQCLSQIWQFISGFQHHYTVSHVGSCGLGKLSCRLYSWRLWKTCSAVCVFSPQALGSAEPTLSLWYSQCLRLQWPVLSCKFVNLVVSWVYNIRHWFFAFGCCFILFFFFIQSVLCFLVYWVSIYQLHLCFLFSQLSASFFLECYSGCVSRMVWLFLFCF